MKVVKHESELGRLSQGALRGYVVRSRTAPERSMGRVVQERVSQQKSCVDGVGKRENRVRERGWRREGEMKERNNQYPSNIPVNIPSRIRRDRHRLGKQQWAVSQAVLRSMHRLLDSKSKEKTERPRNQKGSAQKKTPTNGTKRDANWRGRSHATHASVGYK